ncbi:MAG: glutamate mutase L, partial [Nitrososphaeria archaeon]
MAKTNNIKFILATDVGSTTTKARFFKFDGNRYRYIASGEAPTTVEKPYEDVTLGLKNAIKEIEDLIGYKILDENGQIIIPSKDSEGVDIYVSTSSAGGGLQMMVLGVIKIITTESAQRAALGAGAIVMDTISLDDEKTDYERIETLQMLRPDIILLSGGTDGGTKSHVLNLAEYIKSADPKPRLGASYRLPVLYCGNIYAREEIKNILGDKFDLFFVSNIRPKIDVENTEEARQAIHSLFMEHVMSHAPGYPKLMEMTSAPIMPTPAAEGKMMQLLAKQYKVNVLGVGLGGATTNLYSVYDGKF